MTIKKRYKGINNIIFDLGGVILNIDYRKTEQAFIDLGIKNFDKLYSQFHADNFFKDFEKGKASPEEFIERIQGYNNQLTETQVKAAWNAMLLDFPAGRIDFLLSIRKRYRTFLFSNTNALHLEALRKIDLKLTAGPITLDQCFENAYYSHLTGLRKPDKEAFQYILDENGLVAEETAFVDDTLANVEAANQLNLKGIYLDHPSTVEELLREY